MSVSIDAPIGDDDGCTLGDMLTDSFDMEEEVFEDINAMAAKLERYLARLSRKQKKVLELLSYCYKAVEIQKMLHMTQREYVEMIDGIRCYENIKILL